MRLFAWVLAAVLPACAGTPPVELFSRPGCPHCAKAADWLERARERHPDLEVLKHDVWADPAAFARLERLSREHGLPTATVPTFLVAGRLVVGFRDDASTGAALEDILTGTGAGAPPTALDLPVFGRVDAGRSGLLAFTVAVGLVDGFNPCAMWVLLFLLSLLVHVRSRAKMAAVAGTFLLVSGGVYYLFMTAWLGAFLALGASRLLQAGLGAAALLAAAVHMKDALAPGRGPSLSFPWQDWEENSSPSPPPSCWLSDSWAELRPRPPRRPRNLPQAQSRRFPVPPRTAERRRPSPGSWTGGPYGADHEAPQ